MPQINPVQVARLVALVNDGRSKRYAARAVGVHEATARRAIRKDDRGDDRFLRLRILRNRPNTAVNVQQDLHKFVMLQQSMNVQIHIDILEQYVRPYAELVGNNFILMQDNARPHTAAIVRNFLDATGITTLQWPARSPGTADQLSFQSFSPVFCRLVMYPLPYAAVAGLLLFSLTPLETEPELPEPSQIVRHPGPAWMVGRACPGGSLWTRTLFAISDGMSYGWTAPIIPYLISNSSHLATTKYEAEWLETDLMLGSFCGLPTTIYLVDKIGRKRSLLLATCCSLFGWIVIAVANKMVYIHVVRFLFGMSANMSFVAAPMYIAEIADSKIRGLLSSIVYLMMLVGFVIVYSVGPFLPFYVTSVVGCIVLITELSIFSFMPESPYYLLFKNKPELARRSLEYFRPNCNVTIELEDITEAIERQKTERGRIMDIILVKSNRKAIIIMTILNGGQHLVAISVILMNLHMILESAGSIYMDSSHAAILFSVIMVISAQIAALQVDKYGRKALLLISTVLTGFCLLAIAIYFHLKIAGYDVRGVSWIPIVAVMVYAATFKLGLGIVPIVITAEIFPAKMKAIGMTVSDAILIEAIRHLKCYLGEKGISVPLDKYASVFQAEVFSILTCVQENSGRSGRLPVTICSDSKAAIMASRSNRITTKLVSECRSALENMAKTRKVILMWVPGHSGIPGNEEARSYDYVLHGGNATEAGMRQAKLHIKEPSRRLTREILSLNERDLKMVVGLLTGHNHLNRHLELIGIKDDPICRWYLEDDET
ncbi:unnamed protein product [Phaedon cochleariae]|uniref:Major facilitator superfamily (MFS) profile domain-containing protein n=1 Tax=Phaedon cochleariae TaxID=80249 RepID=A0A9N9WZB4_PHACE|nr:unnamed protein product [Phaedon cochleariae]